MNKADLLFCCVTLTFLTAFIVMSVIYIANDIREDEEFRKKKNKNKKKSLEVKK